MFFVAFEGLNGCGKSTFLTVTMDLAQEMRPDLRIGRFKRPRVGSRAMSLVQECASTEAINEAMFDDCRDTLKDAELFDIVASDRHTASASVFGSKTDTEAYVDFERQFLLFGDADLWFVGCKSPERCKAAVDARGNDNRKHTKQDLNMYRTWGRRYDMFCDYRPQNKRRFNERTDIREAAALIINLYEAKHAK